MLAPIRTIVLVVLTLVAALFTSSAHPDVCDSAVTPAATLLFPYFEVDLSDAKGRTTLISVNNAGDEPTVARVTLWSNVGVPTLGFDLLLEPRDVQSLNLRNLLAGQVPTTALENALPPDCLDPLVLPELDAGEVSDLAAWHTATPDREGLCRSVDGDEEGLAIGYVTVDAMNRCSPLDTFPGDSTLHPGDIRYFEDGGGGLASNKNVLWGDLILINPAGDAAQSLAAVHVRADAERFSGPTFTFYGVGDDDRATLPATYRGRYLSGQPAGTRTVFQLWLDPKNAGSYPRDGFECEQGSDNRDPCRFIEAQAYDEAGLPVGELLSENPSSLLRRLNIAPTAGSGFIEMRHRVLEGCIIIPIGSFPLQAMMIPLLSAEGRFSAATAAVALDSTCPPEPEP